MMLCITLGSGVERSELTLGMAIFCALVMSLGTAMGGARIIKKVAMDMVRLDAPRGFCADISASAVLFFCTLMGLPVSTTHAKTCALMGAGRACRKGGLNYGAVREMAMAWVITFPLCFVLGYLSAGLMTRIL